ncbi:hypothetical protein GH714_013617 [Hevea brasiliensis]|uniref:AB hydrolase-1 domain-containing protein n=1 Tax=Hevea brasiliensis TaxID=3981 RepID=A0A6A6K4S3_HEVBR|nr:hypothetical protein GH714_013617 [Hevea brasiliensis]
MAASGVHPKQVHELRSFLDYFEPLMEFMESLPPEERVVLVGHSMGGIGVPVAIEKFPEKISAGVFVAAAMPGPDFDYKTIAQKNLVLATLLVRPYPLFSDLAIHNEILLTKERYRSVHRVYVVCDQENDVFQRLMIENNPPDEVKVIPNSDHMVMFSKPHDLCSSLMEIGDKYHST